MSSLAQVRAQDILGDGALFRLPGNENGQFRLDQLAALMVFSPGLLDLVNAVTSLGALYVPFNAYIMSAKLRVRAALGTADAVATLGVIGDTDKFATYTVVQATAQAGDVFDMDFSAGTRLVSAGDIITVAGDGGATSTGSCDITALIVPRV